MYVRHSPVACLEIGPHLYQLSLNPLDIGPLLPGRGEPHQGPSVRHQQWPECLLPSY
jgi:hypothetical protein